MEERYRNSHPLRWFPEFLELGKRRFRSQGRLLAAAILVGIVAGAGAALFAAACHVISYGALEVIAGYHPPGPAGEAKLDWLPASGTELRPWLLLLIPAIGGLISGFIVYRIAPEAEGHGTDAVIAAYHYRDGQIRARVPLVKILTSAITIGTGGSGGREGPIAQIGAGFGSLLAKMLRMRPAERRILLAAGMGAGVAAIFRAPLAGALFAAEILYRSPDFESEVILPAGLSCVVSYCTFGLFFGWRPLFGDIPALRLDSPWQLGMYFVLAVWLAILAMIYTRTFYGLTHLFHRWNFPRTLKPAVGAFLTGVVGLTLYYALGRNYSVLSVMSFGYGILQDGLSNLGNLSSGLLLAVAVGKILTTSLTIGSGGSGGVFGPAMVIGGCGGGALGLLLQDIWPQHVQHPGAFIILGMAGFFAAAAKTPFSTLIIVSEMTGSYQMILPSLWVCTIAFLLSDEQSLYSWQVESRSRSPVHQGNYLRQVLAGLKVSQFVQPGSEAWALRPDESFENVLDRFQQTESAVLPVVDADRNLLGTIHIEEVNVALQGAAARPLLVTADLMRPNDSALQPATGMDEAMEHFVEEDVLALPVTAGAEDHRFVGMVRRADIAQAYLRQLHPKAGESQAAPGTTADGEQVV
jgi:CIC family chloride channel protein